MSDVKAAVRTLELIETFSRLQKPLPLLQLAATLQIPQSSCFELVRTLLRRGYLYEVNSRAGYYPSRRIFDEATAIISADPLIRRVSPLLEGLRDKTTETIVLAKRQQSQVVYLAVEESHHTIRYATSVGTLRPLHTTSVGKALLSTMSPDARTKLYGDTGLKRHTEQTICSIDELEAELALSRERGWYGNFSESVADVGAIAMPVNMFGDWYAIAVAAPEQRMRLRLDLHVRDLQELKQTLEASCNSDEAALPIQRRKSSN